MIPRAHATSPYVATWLLMRDARLARRPGPSGGARSRGCIQDPITLNRRYGLLPWQSADATD